MANEVLTNRDQNMSTLVGGIIEDAQRLIRQEITLARSELQQEWAKTKEAVGALAAGALVALLGVFLLAFGIVYLLHWATGGVDNAAVPLWAWFLIVGAVFTFIGGSLVYMGISKGREVQVPLQQTTESLKEMI
jgi:Putative Actinobacterial Holin-X, holin superfamily III